jgi:hypothetical protein
MLALPGVEFHVTVTENTQTKEASLLVRQRQQGISPMHITPALKNVHLRRFLWAAAIYARSVILISKAFKRIQTQVLHIARHAINSKSTMKPHQSVNARQLS